MPLVPTLTLTFFLIRIGFKTYSRNLILAQKFANIRYLVQRLITLKDTDDEHINEQINGIKSHTVMMYCHRLQLFPFVTVQLSYWQWRSILSYLQY